MRVESAEVVEKEGRVEVMRQAAAPQAASAGFVLVVQDRLGTGEASRAVLRMSAGWNARVDEETQVEIVPDGIVALDRHQLKLDRGRAFLYSREAKGEWRIQTPAGTVVGQRTQVFVQVRPDGSVYFQLIEGKLEFTNDQGTVPLEAGEAGEAAPGQAPRKTTAVIETRRLLQWALYYPAVLPPGELGLSASEEQAVAASWAAYRQGDLPGALEAYPRGHVAASVAEKRYRAAVLLATGRVDAARRTLGELPVADAGRRALERLVATVLADPHPARGPPTTAGEALAESYADQARGDLESARAAARRATELAPDAGFAWTRLAELEFSFGRIRAAREALARGLERCPRHAAAHVLRGFLLSAEHRLAEARTAFEQAVALDGALGTAWLGLGLVKIRRGELAAGRADLQTAVTVEPTRSFFYSYHAKAVGLESGLGLAAKDLALARQLDPGDPTPWLYSALHAQQENRTNAAIADLQQSLQRNDNRQVYRSRFLLDQDRAVRSANLAQIYRHADLAAPAVREATRGVESDYANPSTHLFLARSYDALRDPDQVALRYETAWFNELLLANLLAPVGGGTLSPYVTQQEYSALLEADGVHGSLVTEAREGGFFRHQASVVGTRGRLSAGLDFSTRRDPGRGVNRDNRSTDWSAQLKYQLTLDDVAYALVQGRSQKSGDLLQTYAPEAGNPGLRFTERQDPGLALLGYNHRWGPGVHTLFLGGRLAGRQDLLAPGFVPGLLARDPARLQPDFLRPAASGGLEYTAPELRNAPVPPVSAGTSGALVLSDAFSRALAPFLGRGAVTGIDFLNDRRSDLRTQRALDLASAELQHLWQGRRHTVIAGGRWQGGEITTRARIDFLNPAFTPFTTFPAADHEVDGDFERRSLYLYDFVRVSPTLTLLAGGSWDRVERPDNFRQPPVNDRPAASERTNGKLGATFTPVRWLTLRALYAEALGGVSFDESVRLEPVQLAGFPQAFRTLIPESLAGSVEAPVYRISGVGVDGAWRSRTWWGATWQTLREDVTRTVGAFEMVVAPVFPRGRAFLPSGFRQVMNYREDTLALDLHRLVGDELAVGVTYRFTRAALRSVAPEIPVLLNPFADDFNRAELEELRLQASWNAPAGWFARATGTWYSQDLDGVAGGQVKVPPPGDHFWHFDLHVGRRFHRQRHELSVGLLNLTGRDYRLSPLTSLNDLSRGRTLVVRGRVGF
jgi:tetratricopeptide (TPR) repeat protein